MSCGMGVIKYLLFIFNFIFAVCGLAILAVSIIIQLQLSDVTNSMNDADINVKFPAITLIVVGSIIFIISFFGCCGAIRESHCMTITFASFLLLILIIQVAVAVYAFVVISNDEDKIQLRESYTQLFRGYYVNENTREAIDIIQSGFKCCGIDRPDDFRSQPGFNGTIPASCCSNGAVNFCNQNDAYQDGCVKIIKEALKTVGVILGAVAFAIAGVELIGIIFALCLANSIRNAERRGYRV